MKKTILSIFLILGIAGTNNIFAQMESARQITWDIVTKANVNASQYTSWKMLNDLSMIKSLSNGFVLSAEIIEGKKLLTRNIVFADSSKRIESVVQTDIENMFLVIEIKKESLPKGVTSAEIAIFTKEKDNDNSIISWNAQIEGDETGKTELINQLKAEFDSYALGFSKIPKQAKE